MPERAGAGERNGQGQSIEKVIQMARFREARRFRAQRLVESYWEALRDGGSVPARADVDPRGIEDALEYAFILERISPRHGRLRIAGRHLCDLAGAEVRGMPLSALFEAQSRDALGETLRQVLERPAVAELALAAPAGLGRHALEGRLLLLPLRSDAGEISRALGCLETEGRIGRTPRRLSILETDLRPLPGVAEKAPAPAAEGFAEPARPFEVADRRARGAPHLRVVVSNTDD
jgi:hypothetical protein